jgi:hypothetical protein
MVRPIEISDSLTKTDAAERIQQQNTKLQPEAAQHYKKTQIEKLMDKITSPPPVEIKDQVIIHSDVKDKEKEKESERKDHSGENESHSDKRDSGKTPYSNDDGHIEHIDIKI